MKMKTTKRMALGFALLFGLSTLTACGNKTNSGSNSSGLEKIQKIGVIQFVEHNALDATYDGFVEGLKEAGYVDGENIKINFQNAQGEQANCQNISSQLINDKSDLILAIATPAAQSIANATKDIPILVTAVTDPASSKLVTSNEKPGGNVSGTSDLTPVAEQMDLLKELYPDAKKIGMLYCSSETNSQYQVSLAKKAAEKLGMESVDASVSESSEIRQVVESLNGKVDIIYAPTDNLIAAGMSTVVMVANEMKIPIITGEEGMCRNGGLATYGINYTELGKQTAAQAVKILKGESAPAEMPIEYQKDGDLLINEDAVKILGLTIPDELKEKATFIKTESTQQ